MKSDLFDLVNTNNQLKEIKKNENWFSLHKSVIKITMPSVNPLLDSDCTKKQSLSSA